MENEIQKTVTDIIQHQNILDVERPTAIELDEMELRKYVDYVLKEVKKDGRNPSL